MVKFRSKQNRKLMMDLEHKGITFHYATGHGIHHVGRSWGSIHTLLMKLNRCRTYASRDHALYVWMQDQELCLRFQSRGRVDECVLSPADTAKVMDFLGRAPNLN